MSRILSYAAVLMVFGIKSSHGDVLVYTTPNNQVNQILISLINSLIIFVFSLSKNFNLLPHILDRHFHKMVYVFSLFRESLSMLVPPWWKHQKLISLLEEFHLDSLLSFLAEIALLLVNKSHF